jgi:uncharacterized C2H2 Zn-finger protein
MEQNKTSKNIKIFSCEKCNFYCSKKGDYNRHLLTTKHKWNINGTKNTSKNIKAYTCFCGKTYKVASGLWKHKQKCVQDDNSIVTQENLQELSIMDIITQNKEIMDALVLQNEQLMKKNNELTSTIIEQSNTIQEIIPKIGNNNNNTINNHFNIQNFLNEDCKDAINFSEFIENIKITFEDLEHQAEVGYINGVSKLFIENLQELGTHKRPIHCTDKKRKTLYIKENNEWDKEGSQDTLKKGIREVSRKGFECLMKEKQENQEEYKDIESGFTQKCLSIHRNILPGVPQETTISKVIEKISQKSGIIE